MAEEEISVVQEEEEPRPLPLDKNNPIYTNCYEECWEATKNDVGCAEMCYDSMIGYSASERPYY